MVCVAPRKGKLNARFYLIRPLSSLKIIRTLAIQASMMTLTEIARYRLSNQQISGTTFREASEMLDWFGAIQGQEYAQAKWALGLRLPHLKDEDIERELTAGTIVRTHLLRPTWHFVAAKDLRWMLKLTAPRVHAANAYIYRKSELDHKLFQRTQEIMVSALEGGKQLTRDALNKIFLENGITASGTRLSCIMMHAELEGVICSGARQGNQFTYALLEERVPPYSAKSKDEALADLTKRYFTSRGPATLKDFATWSGLTVADCRRGLSMLRNLFASEQVEGQTYFFDPNQMLPAKPYRDISLLPIYDEMVMGYKDRSPMLSYRNAFDSKPFLPFDNTIVHDGQIIGTWKRTLQKNGIDFKYDFFKSPDEVQFAMFEKAVARFEAFTGLKVLS